MEWDTSPGFNSASGSPLGSAQRFASPLNDCKLTHCSFSISGLQKGVNYYVRVYAVNSFGYSMAPGLPPGLFESPKTQPTPPSSVLSAPFNASAVQLTIFPPTDNGGAAVSSYLVEWDVMGPEAFDSILTNPALSLLYYPYSVQQIETSSAAYDLAGTFTLSFGGFLSAPIPIDASPEHVKYALQAVPTVGEVSVTRSESASTHGLAWIVTFLDDEWWDGGLYFDVPQLLVSNINSNSSVSTLVFSSTLGSTFNGTAATISSKILVNPMAGYAQQSISVAASNGSLAGVFSLTFMGVSTPAIPVTASADTIEATLNQLSTINKVLVRRKNYATSFLLYFIFASATGNVPPIGLNDYSLFSTDGSASIFISFNDLVVGTTPLMESMFHGQMVVELSPPLLGVISPAQQVVIISGLETGLSYHFRVYAFNGVGNAYGLAAGCFPTLVIPSEAPSSVNDLSLQALSDTSLRVHWSLPSEDGDSSLTGYGVDLDLATQVTETQILTITSSTSSMSGTFCLAYNGVATSNLPYDTSASRLEAALEGIPGIGNVAVNIQSIPSGTASFGLIWTIDFVDNVGPLNMLTISCNQLYGSDGSATSVSISIMEQTAGVAPSFLSPIQSVVVARTNSVQTITVGATSTDVNGVFYVISSGEVSAPIDVYSSASDMSTVLTSMLTIRDVTVSIVNGTLDSTAPTSEYSRSWVITFLHPHYASLLVSTDGGLTSSTSASGSQVQGSNALVTVARTILESLPTYLDITGLNSSSSTAYVARVNASNMYLNSTPSVSALSVVLKLLPPQPPINVYMRVLSPSQLAVWWDPPSMDGGANVAGYEVKWDTSTAFSANTNYLFVNDVSAIISSLSNMTSYAVGVAAYSAVGYSTVVLATVLNQSPATFLATPMVTAPSAPMNVTLTVVSNSELGVLWNSPLISGGGSIFSYFIEVCTIFLN